MGKIFIYFTLLAIFISCLGLFGLAKYFQAVTGTELVPGVVAVIQTFGQKINFHPHAHLLVTEVGKDEEGRFH